MTLDYQECTLNGRRAVEIFECETGNPLAFVAVESRTDIERACTLLREGLMPVAAVAAIVAEMRS